MPRRIGKIVVADLTKRSKKGLCLAKQVMQAEEINDPVLRKALEHYLANWNEFIHSGFFSLSCEAVGTNPDSVVPIQAAIAMTSAAFDLHDDIIDKSEEKYEIPTVYGKFGVELAVLLGNAFLIEGFELFVKSALDLSQENAKVGLEAFKKLLFEVGNAHALEVGLRKKENVSPTSYLKVIEMKAAAIEADMHLGALFGGGNETEIKVLARLGRILGLLGTLRDEFIDIFDVEELRQKISVRYLPLPLLVAIRDKDAGQRVRTIISKTKMTKTDVANLVDLTLEAATVLKLKEKMRSLIKEGLAISNALQNNATRKQLQAILSFMLEDL